MGGLLAPSHLPCGLRDWISSPALSERVPYEFASLGGLGPLCSGPGRYSGWSVESPSCWAVIARSALKV